MVQFRRAPAGPAPVAALRGGRWLGWALMAATLIAYGPVYRAGFIWNDSDYVTAPALRSVEGFWRIWFELGATEQYYPLLHSAFWFQHRLWGDAPLGYHLVNVIAHAGAAGLLATLLRRLAVPGAALAAFVFALHPVCVESVAWISEQKNTLSLVLYLTAALGYLRFEETRRGRMYGFALAAFVAALLTKSVTATLPAALLVVLWWKRGRIEFSRDVRPLLPWFALAAAMGLLSAHVETVYVGAQGAEFALSPLQRALLAGRIAWFYALKLLWPADLVFIYPRWEIDPGSLVQWLPSVGAIGLLAALWALRHRTRAPLAAALCFGGSLVPTLGFFNVYAFRFSYVADHWQYLPSIALIALAAAGVPRAARRTLGAGPSLWRVGPLLVLPLAAVTWRQSGMYADMRTFYAETIARNPAAWMAHNNLGGLLRETGELEAARAHFQEALRLRPDLEKAHHNLGVVLLSLKRPDEAAGHFQEALRLHPDYPEALNHLGSLRRQQGQLAEAQRLLYQAVRLDPDYADAHNNLGITLRELGRLTDAIRAFERALQLAPTMAAAHLNLALTLSMAGRDDEAARHLQEARRLNPAIPDVSLR